MKKDILVLLEELRGLVESDTTLRQALRDVHSEPTSVVKWNKLLMAARRSGQAVFIDDGRGRVIVDVKPSAYASYQDDEPYIIMHEIGRPNDEEWIYLHDLKAKSVHLTSLENVGLAESDVNRREFERTRSTEGGRGSLADKTRELTQLLRNGAPAAEVAETAKYKQHDPWGKAYLEFLHQFGTKFAEMAGSAKLPPKVEWLAHGKPYHLDHRPRKGLGGLRPSFKPIKEFGGRVGIWLNYHGSVELNFDASKHPDLVPELFQVHYGRDLQTKANQLGFGGGWIVELDTTLGQFPRASMFGGGPPAEGPRESTKLHIDVIHELDQELLGQILKHNG